MTLTCLFSNDLSLYLTIALSTLCQLEMILYLWFRQIYMSINSWIRLIRLDNIIFEKIKPRTYFRVNDKRAKITNHLKHLSNEDHKGDTYRYSADGTTSGITSTRLETTSGITRTRLETTSGITSTRLETTDSNQCLWPVNH